MINKLNQSTFSFFLVILLLLPGIAGAQQFVTWTNLVNTTVSNNVLTKSAGINGWNAGAESQNMLAFGQDGWVEFTLQEVTCLKAIGISYEPSTSVLKDSIKYGFVFSFSGSTRVLETKKLNVTTNIGTYNLNDVFRIEKAGTTIYFLKNGVVIDYVSMSSNDKSFFIDASISTLGGQFHSVKTSFSLTSSTIINPDKDACVRTLYADTAIGGAYTALMASRQTNGGIPNTIRGLIEFDLSTIPRNAKIVTSKMFLFGQDSPSEGHRCTSSCTGNSGKLFVNNSAWQENLVKWNNMPSYFDTLYVSVPQAGSGMYIYTDYILETKSVAQQWVDGRKINYGFTFKVDNEVLYTVLNFKSSDHANTSERPRVEIKYYVGTKYYVNDNTLTGDVYCKALGNSSNSGLSPYSPKASVSAILSAYTLGANDTIFVDAGNYSEAITFNNLDYGTSSGKLVLYGAGKSKTVFTAPAASYNLTFNGASYVSVENLTLKTNQTNCYNVSMNGSSSNISMLNDSVSSTTHYNFYIDGASNIVLSNNKVINSKFDTKQFYIISGSNNIFIINNSISNSSGKSIGVYLTANSKTISAPSNIVITGNHISVDSAGVVCLGISKAYINNVKIIDNTITTASSGANTYGVLINYSGSGSSYIDTISGNTIIGGGYGIKASYLKYAKIYNNYLLNNTNGISLTSSQDNLFAYNSFRNAQTNFIGTTSDVPTNTTLSNNVFVSTGTSSYYNLNVTAGNFASCDYNCYYGPNGAGVANHSGKFYATLSSWQGTDHTTGTGNGDEHSISADPLYPDPVTNNLDIDLFSPCTQAGSSVTGIYTDIYGKSRRSPRTIGAMEPMLKLFIITSLMDSVPNGVDSVLANIQGLGIDTTITVRDDAEFTPEIPGEGTSRLNIFMHSDPELFDSVRIALSVNALGKIDSVLSLDGETGLLDSNLFSVQSDRIFILRNNGNLATEEILQVNTNLTDGYIFSPDGDGICDTLKISIPQTDSFSAALYKKNSSLGTFNSSSGMITWDGKISGEPVEQGYYYLVLNVEGTQSKIEFLIEY